MDIRSIYDTIQPRYAELSGQVAVITGGSLGIGKEIAARLAREGMKVVINGRTAKTLEATAAELRAVGADVLAVRGDVGRTADINRLFAETLRAYETIDLLVNNAADMRRVPFFEVDEAMMDDSFASNIRGPYLCAYRAAEVMREKRRGSIIHVSSVGGLRAHLPGLPYDVTKGALDAMTRAMGVELAEYGIRVNAVAPGATRTEKTLPDGSLKAQEVAARIPLRRYGTGLEMAAAVAFLASDEATYIVGQVLYVDGGITAQLHPPGQPI